MKTYAVCGLSARAIGQYMLPLIGSPRLPEFGDLRPYGKLVAVLDIDRERIDTFNAKNTTAFPAYAPDEFDRMIAETQPDVVIVTGPDYTHAEHTIQALKHHRDVIVEKPMVINGRQARAVLAAEKRSRGRIKMAFNFRYAPANKQLKRMIQDGWVGRITNVEFVHNLDTYHGSSYFYRWNRDRAKSGGLTVTKSTHDCDLLNWLLDDRPETVFAFGALNYFGADSPFNPTKKTHRKLSLEEVKARCPFHQRWQGRGMPLPKDDHLRAYEEAFNIPYTVQYPKPLYIYDPEIDIEDTYSAVIRYRGGASVTFSLNAATPWEGYCLAINGTAGRLETMAYAAPARCLFPATERQTIAYYPLFGERQVHEVRQVAGGHGGADDVIKLDLFAGPSAESKALHLCAGSLDGAYAVALGEAIWRSAVEKRPIAIEKLLIK
jgi:predicted dehydrogenase